MINGIIIAALLTSTSTAANMTMEVSQSIESNNNYIVGLPNIKFIDSQVAGLPNIKFVDTQVAGLP
ncbi:hypothetical protein AB4128_18550, partial [Shewanella sp. 10N.286.52.A9]